MAQIIKHRRGSLESVSGATKRAGELLVVTGSSGITATNGDSILFVGIDGSTATPANKILQGSSVPNLSGASYDTSIDGIPYYDTTAQKLYILNKGGNVEVKATAQTGATGIVSGSQQVIDLLPTGTVSSSEQITISSTTGYTTFSSSLDSRIVTNTSNISTNSSNIIELYSSASNHESRVDSLESWSSSLDNSYATDAQLAAVSASLKTNVIELFGTASDHETRIDSIESSIGGASGIGLRVSSLEAFTGSQETKNSTLASYTASVNSDLSALHTFSASQETKDNTLGVYTSSLETKNSTLASYTASVNSDLSALHTFSASQETKDNTLGNVTASLNSSVSALNTFSASQETKDNTLGVYTASVDLDLASLHTFTSSQVDLNATLATTGSNIFYGTQTITGSLYVTSNLVVQGSSSLQNITASAVDIGTNTIKLNTNSPAVRFGGISVYDSGSAASTGSLFWDSLNNVWIYQNPDGAGYTSARLIAGPKNAGSLGNEAGLTSGSIPVAVGDDHIGDSIITQTGTTLISVGGGLNVTGTISGSVEGIGNVAVYSASVDSRVVTLETSLGGGGSIGTRVSALEAFTSSQETKNSTLGTYTSSIDTQLSTLGTYTSSIDTQLSTLGTYTSSVNSDLSALHTFTASQESKDSTLATYTASLDTKNSTLGTFTGSVSLDLTELFATASGHETRIDSLESWSSSLDSTFATDTQLSDVSASLKTDIVSLNSFSSSINTTIKTKLNVEGVISGSSQVQYASISNIPAGIVSGSTQLDGTTINNLTTTASGSFSGSFRGDGSQLTGIASTLAFSGSTGNDTLNLKTEALLVTGSNGISVAVSNNTISVDGVDASTTSKGVASFSSTNFAVNTGNVSIKANGVQASNLNSNVAGTGISLNGVDNSIEVDYGSTAGTAVEGNTSLIIQGTTHQIAVSNGSLTLGNGGTVTIGLPDDVTISGSLTANGNVFLGNSSTDSVTIAGNLYVQGTTTTVDSATIQIGDNIIELNGSGAANGGLLVRDVTNPNTASGSLLWDSTNDYWKGGALGTEKEFARYNSTPTSGSVQVIGTNGLLVDSHITDSGTDVVITTDLIINGLSANSFLYADSAKTLTSVTPSNAGDMIQWNGSSFVASNTIDGGTF